MIYAYLLVNFFTILVPFIKSFDKRVDFIDKAKFLFPGLIISASIFLIWDAIFTNWGVWAFNEKYVIGIYIYNLPLEEIMFFITVPFACMFTYEVLFFFFPQINPQKIAEIFFKIWIFVLYFLSYYFKEKLYTSVTCFLLADYLVYVVWVLKPQYLGRFLFMYIVTLIPFFIVNGILTGGITEEAIVMYNNSENLNIRIWTIPIEDTQYGMLLMLLNTTIYEFFKNRK